MNPWAACGSHRFLGVLYHTKGEAEKAIRCFEIALRTASSSNWRDGLHSVHFDLAGRFLGEGGLKKHELTLNTSSRTRSIVRIESGSGGGSVGGGSVGLVVYSVAAAGAPRTGGTDSFRVLPSPRMSLATMTDPG